MIRVSSKVNLNMQKIQQLDQAAVTALEMTAEALHTEVVQAQVIPRDTGTLQNESTHIHAGESAISKYEDGTTVTNSITKEKNGTVSIITTAPQARRLYFHPEYNFQKDENPNAKGRWLEDWANPPDGNGKKSEWVRKTFQELYRRLAGL